MPDEQELTPERQNAKKLAAVDYYAQQLEVARKGVEAAQANLARREQNLELARGKVTTAQERVADLEQKYNDAVTAAQAVQGQAAPPTESTEATATTAAAEGTS